MPILQINFRLNMSPAEYPKICESIAQAIADVPGLVGKLWLLNEQDAEAVGIYLFQDGQSLVIRQIKSLPQLAPRNQRKAIRDSAGTDSHHSRSDPDAHSDLRREKEVRV